MEALDNSVDHARWPPLKTFGNYLQRVQPGFDSRLHGYEKLSDLVRGRPDPFITDERQPSNNNYQVLCVRATEDA